MSSSLKFKNALRKKDESARAFVDRLRKIARKEVAMELRVLEQFQDGQTQQVKEMLALHEFRNMNKCILAVTRYEDKARGYGLHRTADTPRPEINHTQGAGRRARAAPANQLKILGMLTQLRQHHLLKKILTWEYVVCVRTGLIQR